MKRIVFLMLIFMLSTNDVFAQCGNCRPSGFSLFYNYLVPGQIKQITNPIIRTNQVVNTVRNPSLLLSPCNPITNTTANLINSNVRGTFIGSNQNSYTSSYIPGNSNPQINQNAFVSNFNTTSQDTGNSYFDTEINSYVWILPDKD